MRKIETLRPYSHIGGRDFIWVAEYYNGELLPEFDFNTQQWNDFYKIDRKKLITFGLIGAGMRFYFDTPTGIFNLNGTRFSFSYITDKDEYPLTQQNILYNDIISYKEMYANCLFNGESACGVESYNFGYKCKFEDKGVKFSFKPIMHIPYERPAYFSMFLVADKDMKGRIVIYRDSMKFKEFECPLEDRVGGTLTWVIEI